MWEVLSASIDNLSQDSRIPALHLLISSHLCTSPDTTSWLNLFYCLALKCYFPLSAFKARSTKHFLRDVLAAILGLACNMGGRGRGSWICSQTLSSLECAVLGQPCLGRQIDSFSCKLPEASPCMGAVFFFFAKYIQLVE